MPRTADFIINDAAGTSLMSGVMKQLPKRKDVVAEIQSLISSEKTSVATITARKATGCLS